MRDLIKDTPLVKESRKRQKKKKKKSPALGKKPTTFLILRHVL